MQQPKNRVISGEDLEKTKEWAKRIVNQWHDEVHPDYVFLTETAGTLYGWTLKEAWKSAYGRKDTPQFYRIDPKALRYDFKTNEKRAKREAKSYFSRRIKKKNPKIIIFDEGCVLNESDENVMKDFYLLSSSNRTNRGSLSRVANFIDYSLKKRGENANIYCSRQGNAPIVRNSRIQEGTLAGDFYRSEKSRRPTSKNWDKEGPRLKSEDEAYQSEEIKTKGKFKRRFPPRYLIGNIVKYSPQRKRAIKYVRELKQIGKEAGEELRAERQAKRKGIEDTLGIISVAGFLFSVLSFSGITGNVIGLTETNSLIGIISILIGLTFGGIYFHLKRKH
ncbi:MAG: hypothetical protein KKE50_06340 [Nanoarchaeota archaeon]|nr:hypothetical protein [Nanoarchaeota archaeon]